MVDSSWDNDGMPTRRAASVWGKVALGCGAAVLIFVVTVTAAIGWGVRKAGSLMDQGWAELHRDVESLGTEAGTRALYAANPALAKTYPTEAAFLEAAARWRPRLAPLPAVRPDLKTLFDHRNGADFGYINRDEHGRRWTRLHVRLASGALLTVEQEAGQLLEIRVD